MLKIIFIICTISIELFANYTQALHYYNTGKYKKAIAVIKSSKKEYSKPKLHLLWAKSAEKLGHLNEAMSAYERVRLLDEHNIEAKKSLNRIYKQTNRNKLIEKVPEEGLYTRGMRPRFKERGKSKLSAKASIAYGYDNNLDATPDSQILQEYFGDTSHATKTSSSFFRFTTSLSLLDDFNSKDGWYAKYIIRAFVQNNTSASFYNLRTTSVESGLGYATSYYNLYLPLSYHKVHYLGKDLLYQYRFNPKIFVPIGDNIILNISLLYSKNNYFDGIDKVKNDTTYTIESGGYYLFDKNYLSTHFKYEHHSAINGFPSKYIGADFWTFKLGAQYYFHPEFLGILHYRFRYGQYDDVVGTTVTTRDDNFHQLDTRLVYKWSNTSNIYLSDTYTENLSNYPAAVYSKNALLFGLELNY